MSSSENFGNPLRKFKLVFLGEQSGKVKNFIEILNNCSISLAVHKEIIGITPAVAAESPTRLIDDEKCSFN